MTETKQHIENLLGKIKGIEDRKYFINAEIHDANSQIFGLMNLLANRRDGQEESRIHGIEYWQERIKYLTEFRKNIYNEETLTYSK